MVFDALARPCSLRRPASPYARHLFVSIWPWGMFQSMSASSSLAKVRAWRALGAQCFEMEALSLFVQLLRVCACIAVGFSSLAAKNYRMLLAKGQAVP